MFESKFILKLPPFSLSYTVREKRRQFQNQVTLKHSEVIDHIRTTVKNARKMKSVSLAKLPYFERIFNF